MHLSVPVTGAWQDSFAYRPGARHHGSSRPARRPSQRHSNEGRIDDVCCRAVEALATSSYVEINERQSSEQWFFIDKVDFDIYTTIQGEETSVQKDASNRRDCCQKATADGSYWAGINPLINTC